MDQVSWNGKTARARRRTAAVLSAAVLGVLALGTGSARADSNYIWDVDQAGPGLGGAGDWGGASNWGNDPGTGLIYGAWPAFDADANAIFGGASGPVTVGSSFNVNRLTFNVDGYVLGGAGTLNLVTGLGVPTINVATDLHTATINTNLAGSAGLSKGGLGTLVLGGNNLGLTGDLNVLGGTLAFTSGNSVGGFANIIVSGPTARLSYRGASAASVSAPVTLGAGHAIDVSGAGTLTLAGPITPDLDPAFNNMRVLTKVGAGTLALTNPSNMIEELHVDAGTLHAGDGQPIMNVWSTIRLGSVGAVTPTAGTLALGSVVVPPLAGLQLGNIGGTVHIDSGQWDVLNAVSGGPSTAAPTTINSLTKTGDGTLRLIGSAVGNGNTFGGNILVRGGVLEVNNETDFGGGNNTVILDTAPGSALATLRLTGGDANGVINPAGPKNRIFLIGDGGGAFDVQLNPGTGYFWVDDGPLYNAPLQFGSLNPITGPDALNPAVASPDVFRKLGPGKLRLGNASDGYATSFTGTSVIEDGVVRLDHHEGLGLRQITVSGFNAALASNAAAPVNNAIVLSGGTLGSANGDRTFSGPINITAPTTFHSQDKDTLFNLIDRTTTLTGRVTDNGNPVTISGNFGNINKGLTLANLATGAGANSLTGAWTIQTGGTLLIAGAGTVAEGTNAVAAGPSNLTLLDGGTFGFRSDSGTTFGNYPALPFGNFALYVGPLNDASATGVTLRSGPLSLTGQTVTMSGDNDYRLAPSVLSYTAGTTFDLRGGSLVPNVLSLSGAAGTIMVKGNGQGSLILNAEGGAGPHTMGATVVELQQGGRFTVQGGGNPLGSTTFQFNGGALGLTSTAPATFTFPIAVGASSPQDGLIEHLAAVDNTYSGTLSVSVGKAANVAVVGAGGLTFGAPFSGAGTVNKVGAGTAAITADNTSFGGTVAVTSGSLVLANAAGKSVPGVLAVHGEGVADLNGSQQTVGAVTMTGGSIVNGTLVSNSISKAGPALSRAEVAARIVSSGGTITSSGGTLRIGNTAAGAAANSLTGTTVSATGGGTIELAFATGGSNPIGASAVTLNGGNLVLTGTNGISAAPNGLGMTVYNLGRVADNGTNGWTGMDSLANLESELAKWVPAGSTLAWTISHGNTQANSFGANAPSPFTSTLAPGEGQHLVAVWRGQFNALTAGEHKFFTSSDDGSVLFIDGVKVVNNNFDQGNTDRVGTVNLTAGMHDIVIAYFQGTGGGAMTVNYLAPGMFSRQLLDSAVTHSTTVEMTGNTVSASGESSISVRDAGVANLGALSLGGGTLRVNGTIAPANIAVNADTTIETSRILAGTILASSSSGPGKLTKTGPGLMQVSGPLGHTGGTDFLGGTMRVTHPAAIPAVGDTVIGAGATLDVQVADANLANVVVRRGGTMNLALAQTAANGAVAPTTPIEGTLRITGHDLPADYDGLKVAAGGTVDFANAGAVRTHRGDMELVGFGGQVIFNNSSGSDVLYNAAINGDAGIVKTGGNVIYLQRANGFSGPISVEAGNLRLREWGTALNVPSVTIYGGEFTISDGGGADPQTISNRFNDAGTVTLMAGTFRGQMRSGGGTATEDFGTFHAVGTGTIQLDSAGANGIIQLRTSDFVTHRGARINWAGNNVGNVSQAQRGQFFMNAFNGQDPMSVVFANNGVLWGGGTVGTNFATYDPSAGVMPLTAGLQGGAENTWGPADNVHLTMSGNISLTGPRTVNTINLDAGTTARTLDLAGNTLTVQTGGFAQRGAGGLTIVGNGGSITAGPSNELFFLANASPGIVVNAPITDNGNPVSISVGGGNTTRLADPSNSFTGGIYIGGSTLLARSSTESGNVLGTNTIYFPGNGTLQLRDDMTGPIPYGNDVVVDGVANIDVNQATSAGGNVSSTFVMGNLTIAAGRTINTSGGNSRRIDFETLTMLGDATWNGGVNSDIRGVAVVPAGATLTKNGGGFLNFSVDNSATFLGSLVVNAGSLQVQGSPNAVGAAPRITVNGGQLVVNAVDFDFSNVVFNPGSSLELRQYQSGFGTSVPPPGPVDTVELQTPSIGSDWDGLTFAPRGRLGLDVGSATSYNYDGDITILGPFEVYNSANQTNTITFNGVISGPGTLIRRENQGQINVILNSPNTYSGGTISITGGDGRLMRGAVTGAFGTGPVIALAGEVQLDAEGAASNTVIAIDSPVAYNANGAAGGNVVRAGGTHPLLGQYAPQNLGTGTLLPDGSYLGMHGQINLGNQVTDFKGDTFEVRAYHVISGDATRLGMLTRGTNLTLEENAVIAHVTDSDSSAQNLGSDADLYFGLSSDHTHSLRVGANTPWKGISTGRGGDRRFSGTILVDDGSEGGTQPPTFTALDLRGINSSVLRLGNNGVPFAIVPAEPGGGKVEVHAGGGPHRLPGANGQENNNRLFLESGSTAGPIADYSGVSLFRVFGQLSLMRDHSQAGVPIVVEPGGQLDVNSVSTTASENRTGNFFTGPVTVKPGGMLFMNDPNNLQNTAPGFVTIQDGGVVRLGNADVLRNVANNGVAAAWDFLDATAPDNLIVRIEAGDIKFLNEAVTDHATFVITGADRRFDPANGTKGLILNGGTLTNDNADRTVTVTNATNEAIVVTNSATFAATRNRTFTINNNVNAAGADLVVGAVGPVDGYLKDGSVRFSGVVTSRSMTLVGGANAYANTNNSGNVINGSFATEGVTIGDLSRFEMFLNLTATETDVQQKLIIEGDYLHRDRRRLLVSRASGSNTRVNLRNVFMKAGSVLAIDESNTDVRVDATLLGDATFVSGVNDQFDIIGVKSDVVGQRRTLTLGRTVDPNGVPTFHNQNVYGTITGDITVQQVKGGLTFQPGSNLLSGAEIYNVGFGQAAGQSTLIEDGHVVIRAGQDGSGYLSGGKVYLDGDQDMTIYVDEVATGNPQRVNNPATIVEVRAGTGVYPSGVGRIQANRNTDSNVNGRVILNQVIANTNSLVALEHQNQQQLQVRQVTLAGDNATVWNFSNSLDGNSRVFVDSIVDPAGDKTVTLTGRTIRTNGDIQAAKLIVDGTSLDLEPGAAGGTGSLTISGDVQVNSVLNVKNGTVNLGTRTITGQLPTAGLVAGLRENVLSGNDNEATPAPSGGLVRLGTDRAQYPKGYGWVDDDPFSGSNGGEQTTVVYSGQILIPDNGTVGDNLGSLAFAESFDDNVFIRIDLDGNGTFEPSEVILNQNGSPTGATGVVTTTVGWHDIEIRLGQGGGGSGPWSQAGWNKLLGLGIDLTDPIAPETELNTSLQANYVAPEDDGTMNLFRTTSTGYHGWVTVDAGATLNSGAIQGIGTLTVNGSANVAAGSPVSSVRRLTVPAASGKLELNDNALIVAEGAADYAAIFDAAAAGRNFGQWNGATGITSATAAAAVGDAAGKTGIAVIRNDRDGDPGTDDPIYTTYAGQPVGKDALLVLYTYVGDLDGNRKVDAADYFRIDRGFALGLTGYDNGDVDYSGGAPDINDYLAMDATFMYALTHGPLSAPGSVPLAVGPSSGGGLKVAGAAVPEPATLGLLAVGALGLLGRRRRQRR